MTIALQSSAGLNICAAPAPCFRYDDATAGVLVGVSSSLWKRCTTLSSRRRSVVKKCVRGSLEPFGSASEYHPSEDLDGSVSGSCQDPKLTAPQTARTILQVNSKAILWLPDTSDEEIEQRPMWPELPYVNDKHGNIYFQVNTDEDFLQKLTLENNLVQAVIGLNTIEMMYYLELSGNNLGIDELEEVQDSDGEDEYVDEDEDEYDDDDEYEDDDDDEEEDDEEDEYQDWFSILEGLEDDVADAPSDWATLESMRKTHPLFFARRLTEAVLDDPDDLMEQQPSGLAIEGFLRPAFIEEHSVIKRHVADLQSSKADKDKIEKVVEDSGVSNGHGDEHGSPEEVENNEIQANGTSFYKLEMTKILLLSPHDHPAAIEIEDFAKGQPDVLAQSAAKIISSINGSGEKMVLALKSLCWRCKDIKVEEAILVGLDSLGFDVRVCSGTQVQTLRVSFRTRATSRKSAKRLLNDMLFPRSDDNDRKQR